MTETTTLPPATVGGAFTCATPGANGWCVGGGALDLSANEPLSGHVITYIENDTGTLCDPPDAADVNCTWDQGADGSYTIEFWAHSSYGDTSAKGSAVWMQDAAGPVSAFTTPLEGSTTPASGVVSLSGTSSDAVSGLAGAEIWVEGGGGWQPLELVAGAWSTTWDTTTAPDGTYFVQARAMDNAGNVGDPAQVFLEVDNQAPVVEPAPRATDEAHPHAIAEIQRPGGTDTYAYDGSGAQTQRIEGGVTYNQTIDAEGRIVSVQNAGTGQTWTFAYDGDGNRVRQVNPDGTAALLVAGRLYEVTLDAGGQQTAVKRYYTIAGQQVAVRDASGTFYLLTDHLGSLVAVLDGSGAVVAEQRYRPFGQPRLTPGISQTDRGFTGQRSLSAAGLQDFNARWFDTSLGGFASPDSLIPDPFSPQSLNRYGYVLNNPLRYTDPTGHRACDDRWGCEGPPPPRPAPPPQYGSLFRVQDPPSSAPPLTPTQTDQLRDTATQAVELQAEFLAPLVGGSPEEAFEAVLGSFAITIDPAADVRGTCITEHPLITCVEIPDVPTLLHELSHVFDVRYRTLSGGSHLASDYLPSLVVGDTEIRITSDGPVRTDWGYVCDHVPCQASQVDSLSEEFADSYMNYLLDPMGFPQNGFTEDDYGQARRDEFLDLMRNRWLPDMGFAVIPE